MVEPMTVDDLKDFLEGVDGERVVYFIGSGAIHDCIGAESKDVHYNNGSNVPAVTLGGRGSNVPDPREEDDG